MLHGLVLRCCCCDCVFSLHVLMRFVLLCVCVLFYGLFVALCFVVVECVPFFFNACVSFVVYCKTLCVLFVCEFRVCGLFCVFVCSLCDLLCDVIWCVCVCFFV